MGIAGRPREGYRIRQRRWTARLAATSVTLAAAATAMVATAEIASAHTASVSGKATCDTSTGQYSVSWTVPTTNVPATFGTNNTVNNATLTLVSATPSGSTTTFPAGGVTIAPNASYTFTQSGIPASATQAAVTVHASWADGYVQSPDPTGSVSLPSGCSKVVTPTTPTATAESCTGPGTHGDGSIDFATETGVDHWTIAGRSGTVTPPTSISEPAGTYTVTAYAASGYTFGNGATTKSFTVTVNAAGSCITTVSPVAPTPTAESCTGPGTHGNGAIDFVTETGVDHWTITGQPGTVTAPATVSLPAGTYTVTAYAASGYTFGDHTSTFTVTVDSAGECLVTAKPAAPTPTAESCTGPGTHGNGAIDFATETGVDHWAITGRSGTVTAPATVSLPAGTYTVTAYPASGYTFGDHASTFTVTVDSAGECLVTAKPVAPSAAPAACTGPGTEGNGSIGLPDTTGVDHYTISGQPGTFPAGSVSLPAGTYTVTAFPASGYTFGDNASSFEVTVDSAGACLVTVQPVAPTASPAACTGPGTQGNGAVNLGSLQTGVAGFSIVGTGINTTGTTGSVAVPAGTYTVTANALPGYTFGTNQSAFTLTVPNAGTCVLAVQVVSPTATQFVCTKTATDATLTPPSYTLPDVTGIQWFVGNSTTPSAPGTYPTTAGVVHVVAQAQAGYVLADNASSQTFDLTVNPAPTCVLGTKIVKPSKTPNTTPSTPTTPTTPTAVLPFTGSDTGQLLPMSVGFLAIGGLLMLAGRRRRTP